MNQVSHKVLAFFIFLFGLNSTANAEQKKEFYSRNYNICANGVALKPVKEISTFMLSSMSQPINVSNDFGGLTYIPFDEEELSKVGNRYAVGLIIVRSGDLGSAPFSALVLSKSSEILQPSSAQKDQNAEVDIRFKSTTGACNDQVSVSVNSKGVVSLDGSAITTVH
jgi:hypothetical protein